MITKAFQKKLAKRWSSNRRVKALRRATASQQFGKVYMSAGILILLATTLLWSILGALTQSDNADQLVNAQLLADGQTFHGASFAGQHSFLFKLPLFYLIKLGHFTALSYLVVTVATVLLTVGIFSYLLYRIEKRPLVFGTLCLSMSAMLLLVPTVPYSGALLPVNMSMVTTRNLEYILYIVSVYCLIRAKSFKTSSFVLGTILLGALCASDKLFLALSAAGSLLLIVAYSKAHNRIVSTKAFNWFVGSLVAGAIATLILSIVSISGLTNIAGQGVGPYGLVTTAKDVVLGAIYGLAGIFTNSGANPAYDAVEIKQMPARAIHHLYGFAGFGLVINILLTGLAVWWAYRLTLGMMTNTKRKVVKTDDRSMLALALISTTLVAFAEYVFTQHYYAVDARYLSISFFTLLVVAAAWFSTKKRIHSEQLVLGGAVLIISCLLSSAAVVGRHADDVAALSSVDARNQIVAKALAVHRVGVLVGDYWRVVPTKQISKSPLAIMPLADCTTPRGVLSSTAWQPDLHHTSFAYLLTFKGSLTDFPRCSLSQVADIYGRPNASYLVSGTLADPDEVLLFYDRGIMPPPASAQRALAATVLPTPLDDIQNTTCSGPTIMNIVAHQDDDLLFLSPDLLHDVQAKHCIRTVYVTAGDAGRDQPYWLAREQGSESAYSKMLGTNDLWIQRVVALSSHAYVTFASPRGNSHISLVFMHLPDGNLDGGGFATSHHQSIASLSLGRITAIDSVDGQSMYTKKSLVDSLVQLMSVFGPTEIRTQSTLNGTEFTDHSDHMTVGALTQEAYDKYESEHFGGEVNIPINFYRGYSIHEFPSNLDPTDIAQKELVFLTYGRYDGGVCHSDDQCRFGSAYGAYIERHYREQQ
jgi:LmbE family N-acetylglucosaminyl deacetylase